MGALELLADAPPRLQPKISQVATTPPHGLVVQLRSGPSIYFGPAGDFEAKWGAAAAVLAAPGSADASYIDVSDPERPAAGVSSQALSAAGLAASGNGSQTGYGSSPAGSTGTGAAAGATGQAASPTQASSATPGA
jgi:hypothetical protein